VSVKTFLYLCCIFITHCHVLDYFQCNHVSVAMRRGSERDNYDHVYSVNEQRGPIVYYASGNRYEGTWMDDKKNGQGVYYFASGNRYEGTWMDDNRMVKVFTTMPMGTVMRGPGLMAIGMVKVFTTMPMGAKKRSFM